MLPVIETMLATGRDSQRRSEAVAAANKASPDGEAAVRQAIVHGVLTAEHGVVGFGIASFHKHMADLLKEDEQLRDRAPDLQNTSEYRAKSIPVVAHARMK